MNALPDRLIIVRETLSKKQKEMAEILDISFRSWQDYELGKSVPGGKVFESLSRLGFCADWLLTGEGPMKRGEEVKESHPAYQPSDLDQDEYALIPRYNVEVSAGGGMLVDGEAIIDTMAFKREWLRRMGFEVGQLVLVTARGDSMLPTLADGDLLLVDLRQAGIVDGAVHVLRNNGHILAKRLQLGLGDQVIVRSDNPIYSALETVGGALHVVGRVVWRGGRM